MDERQHTLHILTAAFLTGDGSILLTHGADGFKFLLAFQADIFIDGHKQLQDLLLIA